MIGNINDFGEISLRIAITFILCGVIGCEREIRNKGAGLRTHILVGVGSALFTLTSFHISDLYKDVTFVDPSRIIAGVVTGIGFLCGGTIIREMGRHIIGLTTAATLWIVCGIGITVGAGYYAGAIAASAAIFLTLIGLRSFEGYLAKKFPNHHIRTGG